MSQLKRKFFEGLSKSNTTAFLLVAVFVLSNIFFLNRYGLFTNDFFENYHYLIMALIVLGFTSLFITDNKSLRIIFIIVSIFLFLFLIVFMGFTMWLTGMAKAFSHG